MGYLLDTCVLSELMRKNPDKNLIKWLNETPSNSLYISALTIGEIRKGITMLNDRKKSQRLIRWLEKDLMSWFNEKIISIDIPVADRWGRLVGEAKRQLPAIDSLLAATALAHNLRMVTRNTKDFQHPTLEIINPWQTI